MDLNVGGIYPAWCTVSPFAAAHPLGTRPLLWDGLGPRPLSEGPLGDPHSLPSQGWVPRSPWDTQAGEWGLGDTFPQSRHQGTLRPLPQVPGGEFGNLNKAVNAGCGVPVGRLGGGLALSWQSRRPHWAASSLSGASFPGPLAVLATNPGSWGHWGALTFRGSS